MKNIHRIFAALIACGVSLSSLAAVTASVNGNNFASGETIQLTLQRDGSSDSQPDLNPLKNDFDVLGSSSGSSFQIINGQMSSRKNITVLLSPRRDGKIRIPPLQWGGEQSAAIELTVGGSGGGGTAQQGTQAANDHAHVFITTTLDQKQPYVQAAVVLTVRLYTDQPLVQASLDFPAGTDVLVKQLGKDIQTNESRGGHNYQVVERKYLLFPQRSGKLSLNGPVLDAQVADTSSNDPFGNDAFFGNIFKQMPLAGMLNATRPLRVNAKAIELNVLPRPATESGTNWLPAQKVTLEEAWPKDGATIHVGEPLTRHLHIAALGLTGAQLPDPNTIMSVPEGIKAYPDQANVADSPKDNTVLGSHDQNIALIASRPGHYKLPVVVLNWWDTVHNTKGEVTLPAHTLDVLPGAAGSTSVSLPPAGTEQMIPFNQSAQGPVEHTVRNVIARPWMWISLGLGLLWLATAVAWWRLRRQVQHVPPQISAAEEQTDDIQASSEFKAYKRACVNNDPHFARQHLLAWARKTWPENPPQGLNDLSRRMSDAGIIQALRQLDRACYTGGEWNGDSIAKTLPVPPVRARVPENKYALPELYHRSRSQNA